MTAEVATTITRADREAFDRGGYLIERGLFNAAEVLQSSAFGLDDGW